MMNEEERLRDSNGKAMMDELNAIYHAIAASVYSEETLQKIDDLTSDMTYTSISQYSIRGYEFLPRKLAYFIFLFYLCREIVI